MEGKAAEYRKFRAQSEKRLKDESAQVILATYQLVLEEVQRIAENRGLKLVLNFSSEPIDTNITDVGQVRGILNRPVLYQSGCDITDDVLQSVN